MKISVIIPTYKPKNYLWKCLSSLINQTFPKESFEIILVLNGCDEPFKTEIEKYINVKMSFMNVNLIHTLQGGVSNARNLALDNVKGEYITFIDDDDFVSPDYLNELYRKASFDTIALCYPFVFKDGEISQLTNRITNVYKKYSKRNKQTYLRAKKYFSGPCMKLIPANFVQNRRFDIHFNNGEDSIFMFAISDKFRWIDFTSENAIYYRRIRSNSAVTTKRKRKDKIRNSFKMMCEYTRIYFKSPIKYNLFFYFTRLLGAIRLMFN